MDPYLEDAAFWEGFHDVLITECMYQIEQSLPSGYISNVKERAEVISIDDPAARVYVPDIGVSREQTPGAAPAAVNQGAVAVAPAPVTIASLDAIEVREAFIEIQRMPGYELVTVVEVLSPWNKNGAGIGIHAGKRASLVRDGVHVVELDLLRAGTRTRLAAPLPRGDYYAMIFRADRRPNVDVLAWSLRQPIPAVPIPLRAPDADVILPLGPTLRSAYERGRYDRKLKYARPLEPALNDADREWAEGLARYAISGGN
jgi:hypothetical protein